MRGKLNRRSSRPPVSRGFTVVEILVVIGLIVVILALLLPALSSVRTTGQLAESMNSMRQIGTFMREYSNDNRDYILPSQFNHDNDPFKGHVRAGNVNLGNEFEGTWADILWTIHGWGRKALVAGYESDSPDKNFYTTFGDDFANPLRSAAPNSRNANGGDDPLPYGAGALEAGLPGYFAANNFFDANDQNAGTFNGRFTGGQIKVPERSLYLVDSFYGEIIEDDVVPFDNSDPDLRTSTIQVDFRYADACLMLFLDGHADIVEAITDLDDLENERQIRVRDLTSR